jgi:hypothetical protein
MELLIRDSQGRQVQDRRDHLTIVFERAFLAVDPALPRRKFVPAE